MAHPNRMETTVLDLNHINDIVLPTAKRYIVSCSYAYNVTVHERGVKPYGARIHLPNYNDTPTSYNASDEADDANSCNSKDNVQLGLTYCAPYSA